MDPSRAAPIRGEGMDRVDIEVHIPMVVTDKGDIPMVVTDTEGIPMVVIATGGIPIGATATGGITPTTGRISIIVAVCG
jgi:hypothetical protein